MTIFSGTLLLIDAQQVPGLKSYEVTYQKIWKSQSVNMVGDIRSTLLGVKAVLKLTFGGDLREDDVANLAGLLNQGSMSVTFFDPKSQGTKTADYIASDVALSLIDKLRGRYDTIDIELTPITRYV